MRVLNKYFDNKEIDFDKLLSYGFKKESNFFKLEKNVIDNKFKICVEINESVQKSYIIDLNTMDEYFLVDVEDFNGSYVGKIRDVYDELINDIIKNCTTNNIFYQRQTIDILKYIKDTYNDDIEYLWDKFPNNGAIRNKDNKKWYAAILTPKLSNFGIDSDDLIEVIDLRYQKELIDKVIDGKSIFPAYHMNKKSWISVLLDGTIDNEIIYSLIDNSYDLSSKK